MSTTTKGSLTSVDRPRTLTPLSNIIVGALAGSIEIMCMQPTVYWKNTLQQRSRVSWNPELWYRGVGIAVGSTAPICALQFAMNGVATNALSRNGERVLSEAEKAGSALFAGALSVLIAGPAELIVVQQQKTGMNLVQTTSSIVRSLGFSALFKGFTPQVVRDGTWCLAYMQYGPFCKLKLQEIAPSVFGAVDAKQRTMRQETLGTIGSGVIAGLSSVAITQPFDTIKTVMQGDLFGETKYKTVTGTAKQLWKEGGPRLFFKGCFPRCIRLVGAVIILGESKKRLEGVALQYQGLI